MSPKGLELIAVNSGDSKQVINKYFAENKFTFKPVMGGEDGPIFNKYGVQAFPTNYVVAPNGKVVFRSVGFDEDGIRAALKKLGVQ